MFSIRDYGAVGDGVTDDLPAFHAAAAASITAGTASGSLGGDPVYVPPGSYRLSDNLFWTQRVDLVGANAAYGSSVLKFDAYKGLIVPHAYSDPTLLPGQTIGTSKEMRAIERLTLRGGHGPNTPLSAGLHPRWQASHAYSVGDKILMATTRAASADATDEFYLECIKGGTSGASEPNWFTGWWDGRGALWQPNTPYSVANMVFAHSAGVLSRSDVAFCRNWANVSDANRFQCRRSGSTQPSGFASASIGGTVSETGPDGTVLWTCINATPYLKADGGVVWVVRKAPGIRIEVNVRVSDVQIYDFLNAGLDLSASHASQPHTNSNGAAVVRAFIPGCGIGFVSQGDDANAQHIQELNISGNRHYSGDHSRNYGICDYSFLGNTFVSNQIAGTGAPALRTRGGVSQSRHIGQYTEEDCEPSELLAKNVAFLGGRLGLSTVATNQIASGQLRFRDWRNIASAPKFDGGLPQVAVLADSTQGALALDDTNGRYAGWFHGMVMKGAFDHVVATIPHMAIESCVVDRWTDRSQALRTDYAREEGEISSPSSLRLVCFGNSRWSAAYVRDAERRRGDILMPRAATAGAPYARVVREDGRVGVARGASSTYGARPTAGAQRAWDDFVVADGYVHRCVRNGTTAAGAGPTYSTTPCPYQPIQVWAAYYEGYTPAQQGYRVGDFVRPRTANGKIYRCSASSFSDGDAHGVTWGSTGTTEPSWPTTLGATVVDGQLTWTCHADDVNAWYTQDGTTTFVCVGKEPSFSEVALETVADATAVPSGTATNVSFEELPDDGQPHLVEISVRFWLTATPTTSRASRIYATVRRPSGGSVTVLEQAAEGTNGSATATFSAIASTNKVGVQVSGTTAAGQLSARYKLLT